jgi:DNA-binding response OmpR family regulator
MKILVVDDDPSMVGVIGALLGQAGHQIVPAYDGHEAIRRFREDDPDVILLDLAIGKLDGAAVCREIRREASLPIIVVTGETDGLVSAELLDAGADDYVRKPFRGEELLSRINAVARRRSGLSERGAWTLDRQRREVRWLDRPIALTATEYRLMALLIEGSGSVVGTGDLIGSVWPGTSRVHSNRLKPHFVRLRRKLAAAAAPAVMSVRGIGYRLLSQPDL